MTDTHWAFIIAAYVLSAVVIGGMTLKILFDYRNLSKALEKAASTAALQDEVA